MKAGIVLGTRPEIIKLSPLIREFQKHNEHTFNLIHTGQHYSYSLDASFFKTLNVPEPDHHLDVGSAGHAKQTAKIMTGCEDIFLNSGFDIIFVQGDTNSVLAGSLAAAKLNHIDVAHVEAGLRSYDRDMPEEINRQLADVCSDLHFVPTEEAADNLLRENIDEKRIHVVGNTIVDAVDQHIELARENASVLEDFSLCPGGFGLITCHRAENVDNETTFSNIVSEIEAISAIGQRLIYPIHPRAEKKAKEFDLYDRLNEAVTLVEPQDYLRFLLLQDEAAVILTDSGGVQEEAIILGTPCITMRNSTERPETVREGGNVLIDPSDGDISRVYSEVMSPKKHKRMVTANNPFGDGTASEQIFDITARQYK